ncbi:type I secretion system permease/ATPase [Pseudomonas sp. GX19020]|uniref:type I secretion system permease/ATPase n=1 Tax=Pseudomonas sp. GX19020 TaxID=2942277 RepID=UPI00201864DF|nr:type I secretion system permease/ATPase [Pseudomonas sp. GX19020]MCL4066299.1 type I secretion system permease/ATPase [Pseudomonas sp. GX19020]
MVQGTSQSGLNELSSVRSLSKGALSAAFLFSVFANLLMLTSPLYMLQIYDRVLLSRSEPTLIALTLLMVFLFAVMGLLDHARARILARIGARFQEALDKRVLAASFRRLSVAPMDTEARAAQSDLEAIARFWASPLLQGLLDLPWTPIFIAALFIFHPVLGWFAVGAALLLLLLAWANQRATDTITQQATLASFAADRQAENLKSESELVRSLGMSGNAFTRWYHLRSRALIRGMELADRSGGYSVLTKTLRLFLQSAILGLGAWLVLKNALSPGAMIAGSILLGRALQPIEQTIGQWPMLARTRAARDRLGKLLAEVPREVNRTALPRPTGRIEVSGLAVLPPGDPRPVLRNVSFRVDPGQAIGVIGLSGSGKSSLARALCGVWPPAAGTVRLDGATLDQYDPDLLGSYIGYLPQRVTLFDGTIAENISRLDENADPAGIVEAAKKAAVHDLILHLPKGYDTQVTSMGGQLSGGQIQRIGLARAFYGNPVMLVLDEPNSNLDNDGSLALNQAIRQAKTDGCAVFIMAHRPAAIQECDLLLLMKDGIVQNFGPRDQVLREAVKNAGDIVRPGQGAQIPASQGGVQ